MSPGERTRRGRSRAGGPRAGLPEPAGPLGRPGAGQRRAPAALARVSPLPELSYMSVATSIARPLLDPGPCGGDPAASAALQGGRSPRSALLQPALHPSRRASPRR